MSDGTFTRATHLPADYRRKQVCVLLSIPERQAAVSVSVKGKWQWYLTVDHAWLTRNDAGEWVDIDTGEVFDPNTPILGYVTVGYNDCCPSPGFFPQRRPA